MPQRYEKARAMKRSMQFENRIMAVVELEVFILILILLSS